MTHTLKSFSNELFSLAAELDNGKSAKQFLNKQGNMLKKETLAYAKSKVNKKEGTYFKSFKKTNAHKSRKYKNFGVIVKSTAPHAHLIEKGHIIKKDGKEVGYVKGKYIFENSAKNFEKNFNKDLEEWAVESIKKELG